MNLYRKYYPVINYLTLHTMTQEEIEKLIHMIRNVHKEMSFYNMESVFNAKRYSSPVIKLWEIPYEKPISELYNHLRKEEFHKLDSEDIMYINETLYRYKYGDILSIFLMPKRNIVYKTIQ